MNELARYDAMCHAIEASHSLDEVLPIRERAAQIAAAAKIARNFEAERQCHEIRVRAERKAGELTKGLPKHSGDFQAPHNAEAEPKRAKSSPIMAYRHSKLPNGKGSPKSQRMNSRRISPLATLLAPAG